MSTDRPPIPRPVWMLGVVSLLMDLSSEMIYSVLPIFLVSVLGVGAAGVGVLEGAAEFTVLAVKMISGAASDRLGLRKPLALAGYGLSTLARPLYPLAGSFGVVFAARVTDRVGKGIRGAPRDALVTDLTPRSVRGAAFGLRQSLDTVGAVGGPIAATLFMLATGDAFHAVFWIALVPAVGSVAVLALFVPDSKRPRAQHAPRRVLDTEMLRRLPVSFWAVVALASVLTLARFSQAFLILRAQNLGIDAAHVPLVLAAMNVVYAASAFPAGRLSDRLRRSHILAAGTLALLGADVALARASGILGLGVGIGLWGLHMGLSEGLLSALVADAAPLEGRGTAFGAYSLVSGLVLLLASVIAGELWDRVGPAATFTAGAVFAFLGLVGLLVHMGRTRARPRATASG